MFGTHTLVSEHKNTNTSSFHTVTLVGLSKHWQFSATLCVNTDSLTVRKGCLVFCSTRLSVTVCATSSWNTHKHTSVNSAITRENNTAVSWYLIGHDRSIYYSLVQSKRTLLLRYERTTATQRENMDTEPKKANKSQWGYKWLLIWTIYGNGIVNEEHHHFSQEKHQQPSISFYINIRKT